MKKVPLTQEHQKVAAPSSQHINQALESHYQSLISTTNNHIHNTAASISQNQKAKRSSTPPPFQASSYTGQQQPSSTNQGSQYNQSAAAATGNSSYIQQTIIINSPNFNINYMDTKNNQYVKNNIDTKGNPVQLNTQNVNGNQYYSMSNQPQANNVQNQGQNLQNYQVKPNANTSFLRSKSPLTPSQLQAYGNEMMQCKKQFLEGSTLPVQSQMQQKVDEKSQPKVYLNDVKKGYLNSGNQNNNYNNVNNNNNSIYNGNRSKSPKSNDLILGNNQQGYVIINATNNQQRSESTQKQRILTPNNHLKQTSILNQTPSSNNVISQLYKHQTMDMKNPTSLLNQTLKKIDAPKQPQLFNNLFSPSKERSQSVKQRMLNRPITQQPPPQAAHMNRLQVQKPELPNINDYKTISNHTIDYENSKFMHTQTSNLIKQNKASRFHTLGDFDDSILSTNKTTTGFLEKQLLKHNGNTAAATIHQRNQTLDLDNYTNQKLLSNHLNGGSNTIGIKKVKLRDNLLENPRSASQNAHRLSSCFEIVTDQNNTCLEESDKDHMFNSNTSNSIHNNSANKYLFRINQERSKSPVEGSQQSNHPNQTKFSRQKSSSKEQPPYIKKRPISPSSFSNNATKKQEAPLNLKQFQQTIGISNTATANLINTNINNNNVQQLLKIYDETGQFKLPNPPKTIAKNGRFQRRYYSNVRGVDNRIKTEMNDSLTNSINILNLYNDTESQHEKSTLTAADGVKINKSEQQQQQTQQQKENPKQNELDKTIDKSFELYFQDENKSSKFIRTNKDIQNFIKNDLRGIAPRDYKPPVAKNENFLNTKQKTQSRKHSASHYIFSTLHENSQGTNIIQDFCYNFDIDN